MIEVGLTRKELKEYMSRRFVYLQSEDSIFCSEVESIKDRRTLEEIEGDLIMVYFDIEPLMKINILGFDMCIINKLDFNRIVGFSNYFGR